MNPTNAYQVYTLASNDGNGTATIAGSRNLSIDCDSSAIGDDADVRTTGLAFERDATNDNIDNRTSLQFDIVFRTDATSDTEGFVGLMLGTDAVLSALPTTAKHFGVFWDRSVSANYFLTSADGTSQTTTDTGVAIVAALRSLRIVWSGDNDAVLTLRSADGTTLNSTQTVTALGASIVATIHFFIQTEAAAAKAVVINEWSAKAT